MNWTYPQAFWGFFLVVIIAFLLYWTERKNRKKLQHFIQSNIDWQIRNFLRDICMVAFMVLGILAISDPSKGKAPVSGQNTGSDIAVAFDISNSMLANDLAPSRLELAKSALGQISRTLTSSRFAIIPFKGEAFVQVPMTEDRVILNQWLEQLGPKLSTASGTNIEKALSVAFEAFPEGVGRNRIMLLISDGEALNGRIDRNLKEFITQAIPIYTLISGTQEGSPIPLGNGKFILDKSGKPVVSQANYRIAKLLAKETGGQVYDLSQPGSISDMIEQIKKNQDIMESRGIVFRGVYRYKDYLMPALFMLLLSLFLRVMPWRKR